MSLGGEAFHYDCFSWIFLFDDGLVMNDIRFKAIPAQIDVNEATGIVECFVAGIGNKDSVSDIVAPGAFEGSLRRRRPRVVWGHDWNQPIGKVLEITEVPNTDPRLPRKMKEAGIGGLFARVQFNLKSERGKEAFASVAFFGEDQEWSIGYKTLDAVYDNERKANILREVELYEVSPVLHGANQLTGTISVKSESQDRVTSFGKSQWPMFDREFAERIKNDYPEVWAAGGNIKGNDQYEILTRIAKQGGVAKTEDQIRALELREAWIARHLKDFRLPGVVAQIKWLAVGSRGEGHMKKVVNDAIAKRRAAKGKTADQKWDYEDIPEDEEKGYGRPGKEKLEALIEAVLKAADADSEDDLDDENKDLLWKLRRLLGISPRSRQEKPDYDDYDDPDYDDDDDPDYDEMPSRVARPVWGNRTPEVRRPGCRCGMCKSEFPNCNATPSQKAGRVLSTSNLQKLQQAIDILREVLATGGQQAIEMKEGEGDLFVQAQSKELFGLRNYLDPILEHYEVDSEVMPNGIYLKGASLDCKSAIDTAIRNYPIATGSNSVSAKSITSEWL